MELKDELKSMASSLESRHQCDSALYLSQIQILNFQVKKLKQFFGITHAPCTDQLVAGESVTWNVPGHMEGPQHELDNDPKESITLSLRERAPSHLKQYILFWVLLTRPFLQANYEYDGGRRSCFKE